MTTHSVLANDALIGIGVNVGGTHLGRALALAAAGAEVIAFDRREAPLEQAALEAQDLPGHAHFEVADQHCDEDLARGLDRLEREAVENTVESTLSDVILTTQAAADRSAGRAGRS